MRTTAARSKPAGRDGRPHPSRGGALMQAMAVSGYGGPEQLRLLCVRRPTVGPHDVLIRVHATGVNPIDWKIRSGWFRPALPLKWPAILGFDVSGEIAAVGSAVQQFKRGDAVFGLLDFWRDGACAEFT